MSIRRRSPHPSAQGIAALLGILLLTAAAPLPPFTRRPADILDVLSQGPHNGDCSRCHTEHGSYAITYPHALQGPDDNTL